jgi:hypothetical protein
MPDEDDYVRRLNVAMLVQGEIGAVTVRWRVNIRRVGGHQWTLLKKVPTCSSFMLLLPLAISMPLTFTKEWAFTASYFEYERLRRNYHR